MADSKAVAGGYTSVTFFGATKTKFPAVKVGDQLDTDIFLEAARGIIPFLESLGKAFGLLKKDMLGNVEKIEKYRVKNPEKYKFINSIVEEDQSSMKNGMSDGCVGVLWLKRALDFIHAIFTELIKDFTAGVTDETLSPLINRAYTATLEKYHGWLTQKMIKGVTMLAPYRKDFLNSLMLHESATTDMIFKDVQLYGVNMAATIHFLNELLTKSGKNPEEKV